MKQCAHMENHMKDYGQVLQGVPGIAPVAVLIGGIPCQVLAGATATFFQCQTTPAQASTYHLLCPSPKLNACCVLEPEKILICLLFWLVSQNSLHLNDVRRPSTLPFAQSSFYPAERQLLASV